MADEKRAEGQISPAAQVDYLEVLSGPGGAPQAHILLDGFKLENHRIHVTISHERAHAAAVAVFEKL